MNPSFEVNTISISGFYFNSAHEAYLALDDYLETQKKYHIDSYRAAEVGNGKEIFIYKEKREDGYSNTLDILVNINGNACYVGCNYE